MGGGGSKGTSTTTTTSDPETAATTKLLREETLQPLIRAFMPQWLKSLSTGGTPSALLPVAQQTVSGIKSGTSAAKNSISQMLARMGLLNTPFGAKQLAETTQEGEQAAAGIGPQLAYELFQQALPAITGTGGTIISAGRGLGTSTTDTKQSGGSTGALGALGKFFGLIGGAAINKWG